MKRDLEERLSPPRFQHGAEEAEQSRSVSIPAVYEVDEIEISLEVINKTYEFFECAREYVSHNLGIFHIYQVHQGCTCLSEILTLLRRPSENQIRLNFSCIEDCCETY